MIWISHRGNLTGPLPDRENHPKYIQEALDAGFDCEVDVRILGNLIMTGHDNGQYAVNPDFLRNERLWLHAKNIDALDYLLKENFPCVFWHDDDDYVITSNGYIWAYPGSKLVGKSICVLPELQDNEWMKGIFVGICSDYIQNFK